jgi:hypothetical protein
MGTTLCGNRHAVKNGNRNKNGTKDIGIQAFDAILQLRVGYRLIA